MTKDEFAQRVTALTPTMHRISYSILQNQHDQADAISESIVRAWEKLPGLREERYFQTWIVRILMNVCHDMARRKAGNACARRWRSRSRRCRMAP